jgi:hypothetical protein
MVCLLGQAHMVSLISTEEAHFCFAELRGLGLAPVTAHDICSALLSSTVNQVSPAFSVSLVSPNPVWLFYNGEVSLSMSVVFKDL